MSGRLVAGGAGAIAIAALCAGIATAAGGSTEADPLWYFNLLGYGDIHDSGINGEGITIAVIDSPINPDIPTLQGADVRVQESFCLDESGMPRPGTTTDQLLGDHGTNIVSYIVGTGAGYEGQQGVIGVAPGATVLTYAVYLQDDGEGDCYVDGEFAHRSDNASDAAGRAMEAAMDAGANIISVSMILGGGGPVDTVLNDAIARAVREEVIVVAGLSNEGTVEGSGDAPDNAPATMTGVVSVLGGQSNGELSPASDHILDPVPNTSGYVVVVGPGWDILSQGSDGDWSAQTIAAGTSIATPIVAGTLALVMEKYPDASGNQVLQSMIHNTGAEPHELEWDSVYGFGYVVPRTLLAADPAQYPAVNPLAKKFSPALRFPVFADIFPDGDPATQAPPTTPTPDSDPEPDEQTDTDLGLIALIGGVALLALILAIVFTVIAVTRKKKA